MSNFKITINEVDYTNILDSLSLSRSLSSFFYGVEKQVLVFSLFFDDYLNLDLSIIEAGQIVKFFYHKLGAEEIFASDDIRTDYHNEYIITKIHTGGSRSVKFTAEEVNYNNLNRDFSQNEIVRGSLLDVVKKLYSGQLITTYGASWDFLNKEVKYPLAIANRADYLNDLAVPSFSIFRFYIKAGVNFIFHDNLLNSINENNKFTIDQDNILSYSIIEGGVNGNFDTLEVTGSSYVNTTDYSADVQATSVASGASIFWQVQEDLLAGSVSNVVVVAREADDDISSLVTVTVSSLIAQNKPIIKITNNTASTCYIRQISFDCDGLTRTGDVAVKVGDGQKKLSISSQAVQDEDVRVDYIFLTNDLHKFDCFFDEPFGISAGDKFSYQLQDKTFINLVAIDVYHNLTKNNGLTTTIIGYKGLDDDLTRWDSAEYDVDSYT